MNIPLRRVAAASAISLLALLHLAGSASGAAAHPQQRQLAVATLPDFRVVLTATRTPTGSATVTAAGYRPTARGWKLVSSKRVGAVGRWAWYATTVCSFTVTQTKPGPADGSPAAVTWDSMTVSLMWGPAIGCTPAITRQWG